jgi:hypothetical protein
MDAKWGGGATIIKKALPLFAKMLYNSSITYVNVMVQNIK